MLHKLKNQLHVHLSKELREKYGIRALLPKVGDRVKVLRGDHKGKEGEIVKVDVKRTRVFVSGISRRNARGDERLIPIHPSNLLLVSVKEDKDREKKLGIKAKEETSYSGSKKVKKRQKGKKEGGEKQNIEEGGG